MFEIVNFRFLYLIMHINIHFIINWGQIIDTSSRNSFPKGFNWAFSKQKIAILICT